MKALDLFWLKIVFSFWQIPLYFACVGQVNAEVIFLALSQFTESFRRMLRQRRNDFPSTDSTRSGTGCAGGVLGNDFCVDWINQGLTKRCRLSWLTISALIYEPKCGGRGGGCWVSANEHSCAHGAQKNFGDVTPCLSYGINTGIL